MNATLTMSKTPQRKGLKSRDNKDIWKTRLRERCVQQIRAKRKQLVQLARKESPPEYKHHKQQIEAMSTSIYSVIRTELAHGSRRIVRELEAVGLSMYDNGRNFHMNEYETKTVHDNDMHNGRTSEQQSYRENAQETLCLQKEYACTSISGVAANVGHNTNGCIQTMPNYQDQPHHHDYNNNAHRFQQSPFEDMKEQQLQRREQGQEGESDNQEAEMGFILTDEEFVLIMREIAEELQQEEAQRVQDMLDDEIEFLCNLNLDESLPCPVCKQHNMELTPSSSSSPHPAPSRLSSSSSISSSSFQSNQSQSVSMQTQDVPLSSSSFSSALPVSFQMSSMSTSSFDSSSSSSVGSSSSSSTLVSTPSFSHCLTCDCGMSVGVSRLNASVSKIRNKLEEAFETHSGGGCKAEPQIHIEITSPILLSSSSSATVTTNTDNNTKFVHRLM